MAQGIPLHVALEGIDGCGKSTTVERVAGRLAELNCRCSVVRYTDKTIGIGRLIRTLYDTSADRVYPLRRLLWRLRALQAVLYATNGRMNLRRANWRSDVVLADRSVVCSYASHLGLVPEWILNLVESRRLPDVAVFLDVVPEEAFRRLCNRGVPGYEEDLDSLRLFRAQYEEVMANPPQRLLGVRFVRCSAEAPPAQVAEAVVRLIQTELGSRRAGRTKYPRGIVDA